VVACPGEEGFTATERGMDVWLRFPEGDAYRRLDPGAELHEGASFVVFAFNKKAKGEALNRRTDFTILEVNGKPLEGSDP
jgi:hypothetical protein